MSDHAAEAIKVLPPASVAVTTLAGMPLSDWVYALTLVYTALQIGAFLYKLYKRYADGKLKRNPR